MPVLEIVIKFLLNIYILLNKQYFYVQNVYTSLKIITNLLTKKCLEQVKASSNEVHLETK